VSKAELFKNRIIGYATKPADQFTANPLNFRKHPQRQREAVNASLRELGWISTVVENVTTGNVIDGHERIWQALQRNEDVPYLQVELSEAEERLALAVFDPITNMAETDAQVLDDLLRDVNTGEAALQALLAELATDAGLYGDKTTGDTEPEIDRAEELREKWGTAPGQLWQLGEHRLICGDCTDPATVARVMGGERAQGVFTSPPYAEQRKEAYGGIPEGEYLAWWAGVQSEVKRNLVQDGSFFVNIKEHSEDYIRSTYVHELAAAMVAIHGWVYLDEFCWERVGIPGDPGKMGKFKNQWEPVFWWAQQARPKFYPSRVMHESNATIQDNNFEPTLATMQGTGKSVVGTRKIGKGMAYPGNRIRTGQNEAMDHPAAFPVDLPSFFIKAFSDDGDIWLEPFAGSGTTGIACENLGRRARMVELDPKYCAVILERWSTHTSRVPSLLSA
jgi:DNA modification methylase